MDENDTTERESEQRAQQAIDDLSYLLQLSDNAAQRLKQDIASENFPLAYKLSKSIHMLCEAVQDLKDNTDSHVLDVNFQSGHHTLLNSSDRL